MWQHYNKLRRLCAFIIGAVFFLSGILKLMDPVGSGLVMAEYFKFLHLEFLNFASKFAGEAMALFETLLGVALMTGLWRRVIAVITIIFLTLFTALTLLLWIFNPEMDCGCFGEAIHLTHFQSFIKNIILCGLAAVAFIPLKKMGRPKTKRYVCFGIVSTLAVGFAIYSLLYIPLLDFTDFKPGARLEAGIESSTDVYKATFVYERNGEERNFTLEHLPDSTWTFVRTETTKVEHDDEQTAYLPFTDRAGEDCDRIASHGSVLVFSIYDVDKISARRWSSLADAVAVAHIAGYTPFVLAAADYETCRQTIDLKFEDYEPAEAAVEMQRIETAVLSDLYTSDYKTLLTMNRSNGGATYFQDGILVRKWSRRSLPDEKELALSSGIEAVETAAEVATRRSLACQGFILATLAILLFI